LLFHSCTNEPSNETGELKGTITISGAFALYPLVVKWGEEFQKLHPDVKVDVSAGGAGKGIADALHNNVNLGMVSREVRTEEITQGAWGLTVARDAVLPTINANNPYIKEILAKGITKDKLHQIWISNELKTWGELLGTNSKELINKYKRSDASGAGETWASYFNQKQENIVGTGVFGDPGLAHAVIKDKYAVGFNNIAYVYDLKTQRVIEGLQVVPIDFDSNGVVDSTENFYSTREHLIEAIAKKQYPSPPGRDLYFISHGAPKDRLLVEFFKFVLTDGQKYVPEMGYLKVSPEYVKAEVEILEGNISQK
jgi:phosphate transport system substrate-binding protein